MHRFITGIVPFFLMFILICPAYASAVDIEIEGRTLADSGPITDAVVYAYKNYEDIRANMPFFASEPTDGKGFFRFKIPEGLYYFTAKGKKDGKEFFTYHGSNPIQIETENIWLALMMTEVKPPVYSDGDTAIKGIVTYKGEPIDDAYISVYTSDSRIFKGLGFRTESINPDGTFNLPLPFGEYIILAKKMQGDSKIRPLKKGDFFCYYPQNPVELETDKVLSIELPCYPKNDRNSFTTGEPMIKVNDYEIVENLAGNYKAGVRGKVVDIYGNPVPNIYVLAYRGKYSTVFMMFHVASGTEYVGRTDSNGNFFVPIDYDGYYYLLARDKLGGSPKGGDSYGLYGGNPWHGVDFKKGQVIDNINIVVGQAMEDKLKYEDKKTVRIKGADYRTDHIIDRDTVWSGDISVNGTVWIKRGVTLTIEPGTVVKFNWLDRDSNGIGDGEIIVEGRLMARGTKEKNITFISAEKEPKAMDWAYILFLSTGSDSILEYCEIQYAFSGLQVHYSNATVKDCILKNNHEGIRYNRSNIAMEHNDFLNNDMAIRLVKLEGDVSIRNNDITGNKVGVLFMQPHGKTVNFFFGDKEAVLKMPLIVNNNIHSNTDYNLKIGDPHTAGLVVKNNWWGTLREEDIDKYIYDKKDDSSTGLADYFPVLTQPGEKAGVRDSKI